MGQNEKRFIGTWVLQEWNTKSIGEELSQAAYGGKAVGHIIYTAEGWVSATLMELGRKPTSDNRRMMQRLKRSLIKDPSLIPDADQMNLLKPFFQAASGYIAYCGTFRSEGDEVHHRVEEALLPQMINTTLTRRYRFVDDTLTLIATMGNYQEELVWRRVLPATIEL